MPVLKREFRSTAAFVEGGCACCERQWTDGASHPLDAVAA